MTAPKATRRQVLAFRMRQHQLGRYRSDGEVDLLDRPLVQHRPPIRPVLPRGQARRVDAVGGERLAVPVEEAHGQRAGGPARRVRRLRVTCSTVGSVPASP